MFNPSKSRLFTTNTITIGLFLIGYGALMLVTGLFQDQGAPFARILDMFDGPFVSFFLILTGVAMLTILAMGSSKWTKFMLILACGILFAYTIAYLGRWSDGFPDVGLISFAGMFLIDLFTLWEVDPN